MKSTPRAFDPPIEQDAGGGISLFVKSAVLDDAAGGAVATVEAWNGTLAHTDRLTLSSDLARRRYVKALEAQAKEADTSGVAGALLQLASQLPDVLRAEGGAGAASGPEADPDALYRLAGSLAEAPNVLELVAVTLVGLGLVGERTNALLIYLAAITRLLLQPVNVIVKAASSAGKSHLLGAVLKLLPASAYVDYTSVSARYLSYCDDDLRHRIVVLFEAGGISDGVGAYIMRSLLSEGRIKAGIVDRGEAGANEARRLEKEGPTALWTSTTRAEIDAELETRALPLSVDDTPAQSRAILEGSARRYEGDAPEPPDLSAYHALQEWLALAGERRVTIPYARRLATLVPCKTLRIRRDFGKLLALLSASAILHQVQRPRSEGGAILASYDDYRIVRELLAESFEAAQQGGITPKQREAVQAVVTVCEEREATTTGVPLTAVAERLQVDKSAASRRLANPLAQGYVRNLTEGQKGKAAAYVPGEPLPATETMLPSVEALLGEVTL